MIKILIYVLAVQNGGTFKTLYQNSIEWSNDLKFPFDSLYDTLKLLYPKADYIEFKLSTL